MNTPTTQLLQAPYLRTQRFFPPDDPKELAKQTDQAYIDIAGKVNQRIIGTYPENFASITGENWYFVDQRQQSLRQIYTFTVTGNIPHGIISGSIYSISPKSYGVFTDGTNWYGVIFGSSTAITGQVSFYVTATNIVVLSGAGAPVITSGIIDLEWITNI